MERRMGGRPDSDTSIGEEREEHKDQHRLPFKFNFLPGMLDVSSEVADSW